MKTLTPVLFLLFLMLAACGPTKDQAIKFNDDIVDQQKELLGAQNTFIDAFAIGTVDDLIEESNNWKATAEKGKAKAEEMGAIDDIDELRKAFLGLCDAHLEIINDKLPRVFEIIEKSKDLSISEEEYNSLNDELMAITGEIDALSDGANGKFLDAQKEFAGRYEFSLGK